MLGWLSVRPRLVVVLCAGLWAGCGDAVMDASSDASVALGRDAQRPLPPLPPSDAGPTHVNVGPAVWDRPDVPPGFGLSRGEILAIVSALDGAAVEQGRLGAAQSSDPGVRLFADDLLRAHATSRAAMDALALRLGATPVQDALSASLRQDGAQITARLSALSGPEFDRAFVRAQAAWHQRAVELIDTILLPDARDTALRIALQNDVRPMFLALWVRARALDTAPPSP